MGDLDPHIFAVAEEACTKLERCYSHLLDLFDKRVWETWTLTSFIVAEEAYTKPERYYRHLLDLFDKLVWETWTLTS